MIPSYFLKYHTVSSRFSIEFIDYAIILLASGLAEFIRYHSRIKSAIISCASKFI